MSTLKPVRSDGRETQARMKAVAQRLFALHGIDGVTVADIVAAAGQRNKASLQYHFGSKDELIGELLVDGAQKVDAFRLALLDQMAEEIDKQREKGELNPLEAGAIRLALSAVRAAL